MRWPTLDFMWHGWELFGVSFGVYTVTDGWGDGPYRVTGIHVAATLGPASVIVLWSFR
jgi:hypothetical protein